MNRLLKNSYNLSYSDMEHFVNECPMDESNTVLFEFLYLLCRKKALEKNFKFNSEQLETFSVRCCCACFDYLKVTPGNFSAAFDSCSHSIRVSLKQEKATELSSQEFSFKNHLIDIADYSSFNGYSDVSNFSSRIESFLCKLPRKKLSSEWYNLYISVLMSFYRTITYSNNSIFEPLVPVDVSVVLYKIPEVYSCYVKCIVSQLISNLKDSFNKVTSLKIDNIYSLKLKELLE